MDSFNKMYEDQINFQKKILSRRCNEKCEPFSYEECEECKQTCLPTDSVDWFKYHCLAMTEEMGEVLASDKRWKTHRNERYVREEKLDELADVFITALNMCIYSGYDSEDIVNAINKKIKENNERLNK